MATQQIKEKKHLMDFGRFTQLNQQFLLLQSLSQAMRIAPDFRKLRGLKVGSGSETLFGLLKKSTVLDRPS